VTIRGTLAALALLAAPLAAQQPVTGDSARTDSLQPRALDTAPWMVRPDSARRAAGAAADTSVVPQANQARGVDAVIRLAL
jgi:hypothetical protein